ncbi:hypothetical protein PIB30_098796 [Stylosanthes scabra]|uniref:Uncharacterized protein n=1 Tax=Stylosanthes scabra TaxID=79078 RepID=A0ABU6XWX1_9FABA|nr:hypothetical protein [Stylosanthes scabra]
MARNGLSPSAKVKAKVRTIPMRASPRLAALRAQASPSSPALVPPAIEHPAPVTLAIPAPAVGRRTAHISVKSVGRRSMRLAARGGPSTIAPMNCTPIEISSDFEPEPKLEDAILEMESEEDPKEAP